MTQSLSAVAGISPLYILGVMLLLYGTFRAVRRREDYRQLVVWGAVADAGFAAMGLGAHVKGSAGLLGVLLFVAFQLAARGLALRGLSALARHAGTDQRTAGDLFAAGARYPAAGRLFALGLLATVGGSPFLVPEGRLFITQAAVAGGLWGGVAGPVLAGLSAACFAWLSVDAVRNVCLEKADEITGATDSAPRGLLILGVAVAALGLLRGPLTSLLASATGTEISHPTMHPAYAVLYAGAFVTAFLGWKMPRLRDGAATAFSALAFLLAVSGAAPSPTAHLFVVLATGIGVVVSLYSMGYMSHSRRVTEYQFFLLLTFASLAGIVTAGDLGAFYGYWELMTFASFFLVAHEGTRVAFAAGLKYYVMCAGGAFLMLPGLLMLGGGGTDFAVIPAVSQNMTPDALKIALLLTLAGFAVKAGLAPLHSWLPDAHPAAPSSVSGPLSGVITKMGIFGIVVIILGQAGAAALRQPGQAGLSWIGYGITFMGGFTLVIGELMALRQEDVKRMLAYSTLGQIGEVALVLGLGTWLSTTGALAHVVNHAVMKDLLFLGAGALIMRAGSRNLSDMRGLGKVMPWTVGCMAVGLVAIMGLPPFAGFFGKYLMVQAAVASGYPLLGALILGGSLVGAVYYTRILRVLVFEERPASLPSLDGVKDAPLSMRLALLLLAGTSLLFGLAPQLPLSLATAAADAYFTAHADAAAIIDSVTVSWPVYVAAPLLGAILPVLLRKNRVKAGWSAVGTLLLSALLVLIFGRDLDTLSFAFALIVPLVGALNMAYAVGYMDHSHAQWRFYSAFCCMCGGLIGVAAAKYLFSFFLFWEIMSSWTLYMAIAHEGTRDSLREAFKYFIFNIAGAGFIFVGVTVLGAYVPLTADLLRQGAPSLPAWAGTTGVVLLAVGFVMKAAQLPVRIDWQMHPALAPTPVSGYISSVLLKSAILGLTKLFMLVGGALLAAGALDIAHEDLIRHAVMWVGGVTIVMASVQALMASNLKLVFIYSTVSQIGYMVLAVGVGSALGYAGGMLHVVNHVFFKDLLFLVCGAIMFQTHKDDLEDLGGIGQKMPFTLAMFAIAGLAVVGVPPSSGFTSKWLIYHALMEAGQPMLALLSLVGSVITLAYMAKFLHAAFMGQPGPHLDHVEEAPRIMRIPMGILAAGCIVTGVFPGLALNPINDILTEYGMQELHVGLSGVLSGPGAWNATGMAVMTGLAFWGGWAFVRRFVDANSRLTDVHTCGLEPHDASSRMHSNSIYAGLMGMLMRRDDSKEN